ncbi:hypothetical protein CH330_03175 [candidate division WOR-3 bacterium JGI_Cruoil_03_51_56]|uniref:Carotenoid biosynthesis protein n=1 Tax=candidate division WOR-3 bacterium JGI_Cruoil_03_51_56 TaxID=1973747 RepID=A0A235BVR6_UNCW3|nr:MAG: hypothetical protein CH330_03175 [candidate division WOR-3 bacterium JGI_Cruoil_03_51_56]
MDKDTYRSKMLTVGIWVTGLATAGFMVADVAVRPTLTWLSLMPVYCLAVFALLHSISLLGTRRALWFLVLGLILSFVAEYLGTNFGAISGSHWFARPRDLYVQVGVRLPGRVSLAVVLTWYGMLYLAFLVATYLLRARPSDASAFAAVPMASGLAMALWQLTAGPVAIMRGTVKFAQNGFYHGIPLSNFVGWFATSIFIVLFFQAIEPAAVDTDRFVKEKQTANFAFAMFGLSLLYSTLMCFRFHLTGAAWLGVVIMLLTVLAFSIRGKVKHPVANMRQATNPTG